MEINIQEITSIFITSEIWMGTSNIPLVTISLVQGPFFKTWEISHTISDWFINLL